MISKRSPTHLSSPSGQAFYFDFISRPVVAHQAIDKLSQAPWLAVDMEFYWRHTYYPQLCLLQVADQQDSVIIDMLSAEMTDQDVALILQKLAIHARLIFHSGRQDWQIFRHYADQIPNNVIDIQYAGVYYGLGENASLSRLVEAIFHHKKTNQAQCSDWRKRPLSEQQMAYARLDVEYIACMYDIMRAQLDTKQWQAIEQDSRQSRLQAEKKELFSASLSKLTSYPLPPRKRLILQEMMRWRELTAQAENRPLNWLCPSKVLLECALVEDFQHMFETPKAQEKSPTPYRRNTKYKRQTFATLKPRIQRQIQHIHQRVSHLSDEEVANHIDPIAMTKPIEMTTTRCQIIDSIRHYVEQIIKQNPLLNENMVGKKTLIRFLQQPNDNPLMHGWRYYFIGEQLLRLSQKEIQQWSQQ